MPRAMPNDDMSKDPRQKAIDNNPCGICRAFGLPTCRGHSGGGGGGGESGGSNDDDDKSKTDELGDKLTADALKDILIQSEGWSLIKDTEYNFEFSGLNSLISITLKMEVGTFNFRGKNDVTEDEQKDVDELYDAIKKELELFKAELAEKNLPINAIKLSQVGNNLTITIPSPKQYDQFIQRVMDKNILPRETQQLQDKSAMIQSAMDSIQQDTKSISPNPFDMSGPKPRPSGWDK